MTNHSKIKGGLLTFYKCQEMFKKAKSCSRLDGEKAVRLENNTYLCQRRDCFAVLLHNTYIIDIYPNKWIMRNGGWQTPTTKDRICKYSPIEVWQRDNRWRYIIHGENFMDAREFSNGIEVTKEDLVESLI